MIQILAIHMQHVIHIARQRIAGNHLRPALHRLQKALHMHAAALFQRDIDKSLQAQSQAGGVQQGDITLDDA